MSRALLLLLALGLGGCADAAWQLGALAIDALGACVNDRLCSRPDPPRPECPPDVDPKAVTWCQVTPPA